jgi:hypothetical protein
MGNAGEAEETPQLGLYAWEDGSDFYNHTQLAYNWNTIDSQLLKKQWSDSGDTARQIQFGTAAGSAIVLGSATGDSYQRFELNAAGTVKWGSGGTITDTNLYRSGTSVLTTDSILKVASGTIQFSSGTISFVGASDKISTNNVLSITRPSSGSGTSILIGTSTYAKFKVSSDGKLSWSAGASDSYDAELSRSGSGTLVVQSNGNTSLSLSDTSLGFFGSASAQSTGWGAGPSGVNSGTKTYNAGSASLNEIAHTLGNVVIALRNYGILGA